MGKERNRIIHGEAKARVQVPGSAKDRPSQAVEARNFTKEKLNIAEWGR